VFPDMATDYSANQRFTDAKALGQITLCILAPGIQAPYLSDIIGGEFGFTMLFTSWREKVVILDSMSDVFLLCHPFQVFDAIVGFVAVFVIAYFTWRTWADKGFEDENMDEITPLGLFASKCYSSITSCCWLGLKNITTTKATILLDSLNSAKVADFVKFFKTNYIMPLLFHNILQKCKRRRTHLHCHAQSVLRRICRDMNLVMQVYSARGNTIIPRLPVLASKAWIR